MRHGRNHAHGRRGRRERALERLQKSTFTPKKNKDGKERNEKNWAKKKEAQIEVLRERLGIREA